MRQHRRGVTQGLGNGAANRSRRVDAPSRTSGGSLMSSFDVVATVSRGFRQRRRARRRGWPGPPLASASVTVHGGTTWMRLKFANGSRPGGLARGDDRVHRRCWTRRRAPAARASAGSATSSIAQNTPSPRTSPTLGCRRASSRRPGPRTSSPMRAAFSTMPSSLHRVDGRDGGRGGQRVARNRSARRGRRGRRTCAAMAGLIATPPSGT